MIESIKQANEILRLDRLEKRAREYRDRALAANNMSLLRWATRLEVGANHRLNTLVFQQVTPYSDD